MKVQLIIMRLCGGMDRKRLWILWTANILWVVLLFSYICCLDAYASPADAAIPELARLDCASAVLMEAETGRILYEQNADEALPPASVTKVMTLLLVMEALEDGALTLDRTLTASEKAASMGGSQIFLKVGEEMSVEELLKAVVISSANDAAVVLAEAVAGSEEAFVALMNKRASELGMNNSHFENTNGLDDTVTKHVCSARDIAIMSRSLISYERILEYSSIWMDSVRGGAFGLTNTNRLVRFYKGATGLKTGSTSKAGFCISATARRDGMHLIAVIMGAPTRDIRNAEAVKLLDWGFAQFSLYTYEARSFGCIAAASGDREAFGCETAGISLLVPKSKRSAIKEELCLPEKVEAPIAVGDKIGGVRITVDGELIGEADIVASEAVGRLSFMQLLLILLRSFIFR